MDISENRVPIGDEPRGEKMYHMATRPDCGGRGGNTTPKETQRDLIVRSLSKLPTSLSRSKDVRSSWAISLHTVTILTANGCSISRDRQECPCPGGMRRHTSLLR